MNILEYAAFSRNGSDWSEAFVRAVDALEAMGGGTLTVPEGEYPTGSIELKSNMTLLVEEGAVLRFHRSFDAFPLTELEFEGIPGLAYRPCVFVRNAHDVTLTGKGILDGQGDFWWKHHLEKTLPHPRPYLVCFTGCTNVCVEKLNLTNSPCWTVYPLKCEGVVIKELSIKNPAVSPNTDGIDPGSCTNVLIENCRIDVGDDCIALKSGTEDTPVKIPCRDILIRGCTFMHGHGGVVMGSEMSGGVMNVRVEDCHFLNTDRGVRLKTRRGRGGTVENIRLSRLEMEHVMCPFVFNMYYFCGKDGKLRRVWDKAAYLVDETTPTLRNVIIEDVNAVDCTACAAFFWGLTENPVSSVMFRNIRVSMDPEANAGTPAMMNDCPVLQRAGLFLRSARNVVFDHVHIENVKGPLWDIDGSVQVLSQ